MRGIFIKIARSGRLIAAYRRSLLSRGVTSSSLPVSLSFLFAFVGLCVCERVCCSACRRAAVALPLSLCRRIWRVPFGAITRNSYSASSTSCHFLPRYVALSRIRALGLRESDELQGRGSRTHGYDPQHGSTDPNRARCVMPGEPFQLPR